MNVRNIVFEFNPGDTYIVQVPPVVEGEPQEPKSKAELRNEAIKKFQASAQQATIPHIEQTANQLIALVIQFRAVGGTIRGSNLPNKLREAADFLEDL